MPAILNIVGCKNSGKTRTVEILVPALVNLGQKVGSLKHTEHDGFSWDKPGKDTFRHFEAGSAVTGIFGKGQFAFSLNKKENRAPTVDDLIALFYSDLDIVLIEGLKTDPGLKIEVCRQGFTDRKVVDQSQLIATFGNNIHGYSIPHFDYEKEHDMAQFIIDNVGRLRTVTRCPQQ